MEKELNRSITQKMVEEKLFVSLSELLTEDGFVLAKRDKALIRKYDGGYDKVIFGILNYWPYCITAESIGFYIRIDAVEEILFPIAAKNGLRDDDPKRAKLSTTISEGMEFHTELFSEQDVDSFILNHILSAKEAGLTFFSKYKKMSEINEYYKHEIWEDGKNEYHVLWDWFPISTSLTLMKLCGDKDLDEMRLKYRHMLEIRYRQIETFTGEKYWAERQSLKAYDDLVKYLSGM